MKTIPLTRGLETIVDSKVYDFLMEHGWFAHKGTQTFYAARNPKLSDDMCNRSLLLMHRVIWAYVGRELPQFLDHRNRNGLDNRLRNLRPATRTENNRNARLSKNNKSGYKGVSWHSQNGMWRVSITVNYKHIHLGLFHDVEEAAECYRRAARKYHGEFASY